MCEGKNCQKEPETFFSCPAQEQDDFSDFSFFHFLTKCTLNGTFRNTIRFAATSGLLSDGSIEKTDNNGDNYHD